MSDRIRLNLSGEPLDYCPFCDNSGWVYLRKTRPVKARGGEYQEQPLAPCGWCESGHSHHRRFGGAWNYRPEDVLLEIHGDPDYSLRPHEQAAFLRSQSALASQMALEHDVDTPTQVW